VQLHDNAADDAKVEIENAILQRGDSLTIDMRAGGGFLGRFSSAFGLAPRLLW